MNDIQRRRSITGPARHPSPSRASLLLAALGIGAVVGVAWAVAMGMGFFG